MLYKSATPMKLIKDLMLGSKKSTTTLRFFLLHKFPLQVLCRRTNVVRRGFLLFNILQRSLQFHPRMMIVCFLCFFNPPFIYPYRFIKIANTL